MTAYLNSDIWAKLLKASLLLLGRTKCAAICRRWVLGCCHFHFQSKVTIEIENVWKMHENINSVHWQVILVRHDLGLCEHELVPRPPPPPPQPGMVQANAQGREIYGKCDCKAPEITIDNWALLALCFPYLLIFGTALQCLCQVSMKM